VIQKAVRTQDVANPVSLPSIISTKPNERRQFNSDLWTEDVKLQAYRLNVAVTNLLAEYSRVNDTCWCQWPRGLKRRSAAARLLRVWVRIPPRAWMPVCWDCRVLSGGGLCDEIITRPEESYRMWCVVVCDLETSWMRRPWPWPWPTRGNRARKEKKKTWSSFNDPISISSQTVIRMAINSKMKATWKEAFVAYTWYGICLQEYRISGCPTAWPRYELVTPSQQYRHTNVLDIQWNYTCNSHRNVSCHAMTCCL
jgi:hypothetical protein